MKNIIDGKSRVLCDFCGCDDEQASIVDQGEVAICDGCVSQCFLLLMNQTRRPTMKVDECPTST